MQTYFDQILNSGLILEQKFWAFGNYLMFLGYLDNSDLQDNRGLDLVTRSSICFCIMQNNGISFHKIYKLIHYT